MWQAQNLLSLLRYIWIRCCYQPQMLLSASFVQFLPLFKTDYFLYHQHGIFRRIKNDISAQKKKRELVTKHVPCILLSFLSEPEPVLPEQIRTLQYWLNIFGTGTFPPLRMLALKHKNVDIISLSMCFHCFSLLLILFITCFSTHVSVIYFPACLQLSAWVYHEKLFIALHATQKILYDSVQIFLSLRQQWLNNHCNIHIYPMKLC